MKGLAVLAVGLCLCASGAEPQRAKAKGDIHVSEAKGHRSEDRVSVDGRVLTTSEKPTKGLILAFDFLSDEGEVLTTQKVQISDDTVASGEDLPFHVETNNPPGSIRFRIRAFDTSDKELKVIGGGPYIID